jgi:hypothetical protein
MAMSLEKILPKLIDGDDLPLNNLTFLARQRDLRMIEEIAIDAGE